MFGKNHSIIIKQSSKTKKVIQNTHCVGTKTKSKVQQPEETDQKPLTIDTGKKKKAYSMF